MRKILSVLLSTAAFTISSPAFANSHCEPVCNDPASCFKLADWIADGEVYNVERGWDDSMQREVAEFDFVIERWIRGEMRYGHFLHFNTSDCCLNIALPEDTSGFFRFYGGKGKNEFIYFEKDQ